MNPLKADQEDIREIIHAAQVIRKAITDNHLQVAYVMEALMGLYADQASRFVSYEEYCDYINLHKESFKHLWRKP